MRKIVAAALGLLLVGCATKVQHPNKSSAEMQADVRFCKAEANRRFYFDPVAALYHAYGCLDAKGYERGSVAMQPDVERALIGTAAAPRPAAAPEKREPVKPCTVPCRKPN